MIGTEEFYLSRSTTCSPVFQLLVAKLDQELRDELKEAQEVYELYNKVPDIKTAVVVLKDELPVACGCFKQFDEETVEIKRMFVAKDFRGKGISKRVLGELEKWAAGEGYKHAVLETSRHLLTAINLYKTQGYYIIPNYGQYIGLDDSVCMKKKLNA
jgi:putative acetyltransferase